MNFLDGNWHKLTYLLELSHKSRNFWKKDGVDAIWPLGRPNPSTLVSQLAEQKDSNLTCYNRKADFLGLTWPVTQSVTHMHENFYLLPFERCYLGLRVWVSSNGVCLHLKNYMSLLYQLKLELCKQKPYLWVVLSCHHSAIISLLMKHWRKLLISQL